MCVFVQTETVEEPIDEDEAETQKAETESEDTEKTEDGDEDAVVEEEDKEDKPKTKKVEKTTWDWVLVNDTKPIWLRRYLWSFVISGHILCWWLVCEVGGYWLV